MLFNILEGYDNLNMSIELRARMSEMEEDDPHAHSSEGGAECSVFLQSKMFQRRRTIKRTAISCSSP